MEVILPYIKVNQLIFLPQIDTKITKDNVKLLPSYENYKPLHNLIKYKGCKECL